MKKALPFLLLILPGCGLIPGYNGAGSGAGTTDAGSPQTGTTTQSPGAQNSGTPASAASTATRTTTFDTNRKLEYADVWVDMGDAAGQRALVPYLMKPEDWRLVGCEMTSTTSKHYRFMRVSTADGKSLPQVDIFKQGR